MLNRNEFNKKKKKKTNKYTKQCFHRNYSEINHY